MLSPHLLQLIRLEVAVLGREADGLLGLSGINPANLQRHLERLYLGGEIAGASTMEAGRLRISIEGLTPCGQLELCTFQTTSSTQGGQQEPER